MFFSINLCYNQLILVHVEGGEKLYPNFDYGNMNISCIFIVRKNKNVMGNCAWKQLETTGSTNTTSTSTLCNNMQRQFANTKLVTKNPEIRMMLKMSTHWPLTSSQSLNVKW